MDALTEEQCESILRRAADCMEEDCALRARLVSRRRALGLTVAEVADRTGLSKKAIRRFERYWTDPTIATLRRYAVAVDASYRHEMIEEEPRG